MDFHKLLFAREQKNTLFYFQFENEKIYLLTYLHALEKVARSFVYKL